MEPSVETFFYFCFIGLRRLKDRDIYIMTVVGYVVVLVLEVLFRDAPQKLTHWMCNILPATRLPEFLMGMSVYRLYRSGTLHELRLP